jgi:hypothetical protein
MHNHATSRLPAESWHACRKLEGEPHVNETTGGSVSAACALHRESLGGEIHPAGDEGRRCDEASLRPYRHLAVCVLCARVARCRKSRWFIRGSRECADVSGRFQYAVVLVSSGRTRSVVCRQTREELGKQCSFDSPRRVVARSAPTCVTISCNQSRRTTLRSELLIFNSPLYSMNPSFRNLFMKKLTRERVVPIISANIS